MTSRWGLAIALVAVLFYCACERHERTQGGVSARADSYFSGDAKTEGASSSQPAHVPVVANYSNTPGLSNISEVAPKSGNGPDGQEIYTRICIACHQANGQGVPGAFPPLDGSPYVTGPNVERMASIMLYGLMGPINVKGATFNSVMTPQADALSDAELAAVASFIRSSWSNKASAIEPAVFTKMRQKYGKRASFTIQELGEEK